MTASTPRIVLIDSGVNAHHPHIRDSGTIVPDDQEDRLGHGTAAAAAILHLAPGCEIHSLKIFEDRPVCPFERVLAALETALGLAPKLVNLSLGTPQEKWKQDLLEITSRIRNAGITLVAPAAMERLPSYPGCLDAVTGVLMDARLPRESPELRETDGHSFWYASPYPRDLPDLPRGANLAGVSMATANVTGYLAQRTP